jgi:choice-of-anchor C domain-containing protein
MSGVTSGIYANTSSLGTNSPGINTNGSIEVSTSGNTTNTNGNPTNTNGNTNGDSSNPHPQIVNGSFELGPWSNNSKLGSFMGLPGGSTTIPNWVTGGKGIDWVRETLWAAADGIYSVDLSGLGIGSIEQTLTTTVGTTYLVNFELSGNRDCNPLIKHLTVSAGSYSEQYTYDVKALQSYNTAPMAMTYTTETFTFTAESTSTVLKFTSGDATWCGPVIDNVR